MQIWSLITTGCSKNMFIEEEPPKGTSKKRYRYNLIIMSRKLSMNVDFNCNSCAFPKYLNCILWRDRTAWKIMRVILWITYAQVRTI